MKKILTLLTFVFLTNAMLFGQCPDTATPNPTGSRFNLGFFSETDRDDALVGLVSIDFPAAGGGTITILVADLLLDGPVGTPDQWRIRGVGSSGDFGGVNGNFDGDIVFNYAGSSVTCTYTAGALPVDLISFDGIKKDRQINLTWETASEFNNEGFVVERGHKTSDGIEWDRLDFIEGKGTTEALQVYSFIDQNPVEGNNYYRLKQMDYDGKYEYSSVVAVEYSTNTGSIPAIFPNPAKDHLTLMNGKGMATIYNALGQAVKHFTIDSNQATIQLADLLNGQYYLQVIQEDGTSTTKQFAKVN